MNCTQATAGWVGLSVIPTPTPVIPALSHVIPAKAGISPCAIGRTVIPTLTHVIPAPSHVIPALTHIIPTSTHVIPAKAGISPCAIGRTAWRVAVPSRHAPKGNGTLQEDTWSENRLHGMPPLRKLGLPEAVNRSER